MIFFTDTHFIHESSNELLLNLFTFTKSSILTTITNKSAQKTIKIIHISYKKQAPNSGELMGVSQS